MKNKTPLSLLSGDISRVFGTLCQKLGKTKICVSYRSPFHRGSGSSLWPRKGEGVRQAKLTSLDTTGLISLLIELSSLRKQKQETKTTNCFKLWNANKFLKAENNNK